jgi:hypothetical protein
VYGWERWQGGEIGWSEFWRAYGSITFLEARQDRRRLRLAKVQAAIGTTDEATIRWIEDVEEELDRLSSAEVQGAAAAWQEVGDEARRAALRRLIGTEAE